MSQVSFGISAAEVQAMASAPSAFPRQAVQQQSAPQAAMPLDQYMGPPPKKQGSWLWFGTKCLIGVAALGVVLAGARACPGLKGINLEKGIGETWKANKWEGIGHPIAKAGQWVIDTSCAFGRWCASPFSSKAAEAAEAAGDATKAAGDATKAVGEAVNAAGEAVSKAAT